MHQTDIDIPVHLEDWARELGVALPEYNHQGDSGMDLQAAIESPITLVQGDRALIPTGLWMAIPLHFELQIRPRSGLGSKLCTVPNTPGTIDASFRGQVKVPVVNLNREKDWIINPGDRIAQAVIAPVVRANWLPTTKDNLPETVRGEGGFESTGE